MNTLISYGAIAFELIGAAFGLRAATVHVRDSLDQFIGDIQRQSRWATYTAIAATISATLQALEKSCRNSAIHATVSAPTRRGNDGPGLVTTHQTEGIR